MENWKKILLRAAGFGGGFAVVGAVILGVVIWWVHRPVKPKPWDTKAITATYYQMDTEGDKNTVEFEFTLENNADADYRVEDGFPMHLAATLERSNSLSFDKDEFMHADYPLYIPAHSRVLFTIHVKYPYPIREDLSASEDVRHDWETTLTQYAVKEFSNLNGFALLDDTNRYKILMPPGWKERAKEPLRVKAPDTSK